MGTTVVPTILLPDTDDVLRVCWIDGNPGLDLGVNVIGTRLTSVRTTGVGVCAGDRCECERASICQRSTDRGHNSHDNQQYRGQCHHSDRLQMTHRNPPDVKIANSSLKDKK